MAFYNVIAKFASFTLWLWTEALPQPIGALFGFALSAALFMALFKLLWGLI